MDNLEAMSTVIDDKTAKENLAANVRRLLEARNLTQMELAEITGEQQSLISRIANGRNMPGGTVLARIAEALDISIDRLLAPSPEKISANQ